MKASGKMSVGHFEEEFKKEFCVKIEIKQGGEFADNKATLASLSPKDFSGHKNAQIAISGKTLVKNVKKKSKKHSASTVIYISKTNQHRMTLL